MIAKGAALFDDKQCSTCHETKTGASSDEAPNLFGYGSEAWLTQLVKKPSHFFAHDDKMPAFEGKLSDAELHALAVYLRGLRQPESDE
jgi:ubiquinol-cytochrome c reductase cytochrome b subunit